MVKGILVYTSADAEYNKWFIDHIIEEGRKCNLDIRLVLSDKEEVSDIDEISDREEVPDNDIDFAIVRNRDSKLCKRLEENNIRCFNSSYVVNIGNDKWEMYKDFNAAGIPVMYTQRTKLPYPFVMKPVDGHGGENVYLIKNADEYKKAIDTKPDEKTGKFIFQVPATEKGRDIRVYVVGGIILTAMERIALDSEKDFRSNFSLNGNAREHALTDEELKLAAKVADHIKADFVGIDLIYNNGKPVVNEIEDAVGTRMLYSLTDIDPVREFVAHIAEHI
ncbi:MAG: ATP-grasp domain-containing protein [Lachnospiraceae bacterium]|nr:ATP-grasp domain-containing protein [Lachnospiraceae bacterium]